MKSSLTITNPDGWLHERYFEKLSARIRASLQGYVRRRNLHVQITTDEDYMLTASMELGPMRKSSGDTDEFVIWGEGVHSAVEKFKAAGFTLASVRMRHERRVISPNTHATRVPVLYATFFMNVPCKHWTID